MRCVNCAYLWMRYNVIIKYDDALKLYSGLMYLHRCISCSIWGGQTYKRSKNEYIIFGDAQYQWSKSKCDV